MKFNVDKSKCIGCGACVAEYGEYFSFDQDGLSEVISDNVPANAEEVINICPVEAISIENACACSHECHCGDDCSCNDEEKCNDDCCCNE